MSYVDRVRKGRLTNAVNGALKEVERGEYTLSELRSALITGLKYQITSWEHCADIFMEDILKIYRKNIEELETGKPTTLNLPCGYIYIPSE